MASPEVQIHRMRRNAGLSVMGTDGTVYLDATEARRLARALYALARDLESVPFTESTLAPVTVPAWRLVR